MFFEKEKGLQSWTYFGGFWKLLRIAFCIVCNLMLELLHLAERIWSSSQLWCESLQLTQWTLTDREHTLADDKYDTFHSKLWTTFPRVGGQMTPWEKELSFTLFSPPPTSRPGPTVILSIFVIQKRMISSYQWFDWTHCLLAIVLTYFLVNSVGKWTSLPLGSSLVSLGHALCGYQYRYLLCFRLVVLIYMVIQTTPESFYSWAGMYSLSFFLRLLL